MKFLVPGNPANVDLSDFPIVLLYHLDRNIIEATKLLIEEEEGIMFYVMLFLRQDRWRACVVMIAGVEACKHPSLYLSLCHS